MLVGLANWPGKAVEDVSKASSSAPRSRGSAMTRVRLRAHAYPEERWKRAGVAERHKVMQAIRSST